MFKGNSLYFGLSPLCHVTSAGTTEKSWLHPLCSLPSGIYILYNKILRALSSWGYIIPALPSAFPTSKCLSVFVAPFWMHTIKPRLSSTREPRTRHSTRDVISTKFNHGEKPPPWTCWWDSSKHSPGWCWLPLPQGHIASWCSAWGPPVLFSTQSVLSLQQGMWLLCLRYRTWHLPLSNFMGSLSANFFQSVQVPLHGSTILLHPTPSNETRQGSHPVLHTTMWLSLLMTQTLWREQHQPSWHELWARNIISQLNNMDIFSFSYSHNFSCHRALWGHLCSR